MLGFLINIESSDEGSDWGGLVTATRLLHRSRGEILMRIPLIKVPGLFSPLSSGVHDVTILLQHLSAINVVVAEATGGGDRVDCSRILTNIFPYDDGMSLTDELSITYTSTCTCRSEERRTCRNQAVRVHIRCVELSCAYLHNFLADAVIPLCLKIFGGRMLGFLINIESSDATLVF